MKKNNKHKKINKNNQKIKTLLIAASLLICCCLILVILIGLTKEDIYKIDSRVKYIEKESKIENSDLYKTTGWLKVQGTKIDSPVITYDNILVLNHVPKENFLWTNQKDEKIHNQTTILGHNIMNLSSHPEINKEYFMRFDDLMSFVYEDFAKENKYIQYTIDGKDYIYKIFGVFFEEEYELYTNRKGDFTKEQLGDYIKKVKNSSIYDYDVKVDENDSVITLVTCTRFFGKRDTRKFVVVGRLLKDNEKMSNYEVKTNKNYQEVKKKMKGDKQDDKTQKA